MTDPIVQDAKQEAVLFWKKSVVFAEVHPEWVIRVALLIAGVVLGHFFWR